MAPSWRGAGSVSDRGEAAVGARGLSGEGYRGHVFWDSAVFVLPFRAVTYQAAARAMLEYRIRRLPAARQAALQLGRAGARFPWESAQDGFDVTPTHAHLPTGEIARIRTGELEEHRRRSEPTASPLPRPSGLSLSRRSAKSRVRRESG